MKDKSVETLPPGWKWVKTWCYTIFNSQEETRWQR
ncbi:MAG: hypothetical protein Pg6C_17400 [Treponemataceae bacterium]|nr:MAG: hypothetical protein Pg6C_17400 [Treponemataceae bacterium]